MLNITANGDITLTIRGKLIATLYAPYCDTLTPKELVNWENVCRRDYYEATGIWTEEHKRREKANQLKMREAYPLYQMRVDSSIDEQYSEEQHAAIDG